jgi:GNAT superfamily N-acetyltransferase
MIILAVVEDGKRNEVTGIGEYYIEDDGMRANVAFAVRDGCQNRGVGTELLSYLVLVAKKRGLLGFTAEVLKENEPMLRVFEKMKLLIERTSDGDSYRLRVTF